MNFFSGFERVKFVNTKKFCCNIVINLPSKNKNIKNSSPLLKIQLFNYSFLFHNHKKKARLNSPLYHDGFSKL